MAGRKKTRIPLQVFLNGRLVGHLRRESNGAIDFQYAADWLSWQYAFPISLSLPLREDRYIGEPPRKRRTLSQTFERARGRGD